MSGATITILCKEMTGHWIKKEIDPRVWKAFCRWSPNRRSKWLDDSGNGSLNIIELNDMQETKRISTKDR